MKKSAEITVLGLLGNSVFLQVPHFHSEGETLNASSLYMEPGGKGSNQAVAAARLGAHVSFLSCMGRDSIAEDCVSFLEQEGIDCYTEYIDGIASPYACILTDSSGENRVTVHSGSAMYLSSDFVKKCEDIIAASDLLLLNNECPPEANRTALDIALRHGVTTVLNPAPYLPLQKEYLTRFSMVTPNRHEAAMLCGLPPESDANILLQGLRSMGIPCPVITLGGEGASFWDGKKAVHCRPPRVTVRDTTGAGDCFNGALCCGMADGLSMEKAVRFAVNAAAFSVTKKYVMPSLPRLKELQP